MLFEDYLEERRKEGAAMPSMVMQEVNRTDIVPKYAVTPTGDNFELFAEQQKWLKENHPDAKYLPVFGGIDWLFEDEFVAMCFKLRWS